MTDIEMLKKIIRESGLKLAYVAEKSGIKRPTLYNRLKGVGDFTAAEIVGLAEALHMTRTERDRIFFAVKGDKTSTGGE